MRYILKVSYDGKDYAGFQKQNNERTIQEDLENALTKALGQDISIVASGRTDAGVSAIEQVCHFDVEGEIDTHRTIGYVNSLLSREVRVLCIEKSDDEFHSRYSAKRKTYEYYFYSSKVGIPVYDRFASQIGYNLDIEVMQQACECFKGEHDFTSFCTANTSVVNKVRTIYDIHIDEVNDDLYKLSITGNGFLYNMVRIIMGTLVEVGMSKKTIQDVSIIINSKDRNNAGKTAEAKGLFLKKVEY